ncbi:MAG: 2-amino-4-hydroxy-6-hydroxymethyldihydropteridine diphosphokinase [Chlorobi bacterium]|nr:2-amino-4-hydroxy-6-hydroxymethyldihydropteridine diphosphokinase [Chlorobiota bacterium]
MQLPTRVFLLTGSNIEPRISYLQEAEKMIGKQIGIILQRTEIYESEPWGFQAENNFLNLILEVETFLTPKEVLDKLLMIEKRLGRLRKGTSYSSRTIDIDILYFGNETIKEKALQIPHPRLHLRRFTLLPLVEIAPEFEHPVLKKTNRELLDRLTDDLEVWKYQEVC